MVQFEWLNLSLRSIGTEFDLRLASAVERSVYNMLWNTCFSVATSCAAGVQNSKPQNDTESWKKTENWCVSSIKLQNSNRKATLMFFSLFYFKWQHNKGAAFPSRTLTKEKCSPHQAVTINNVLVLERILVQSLLKVELFESRPGLTNPCLYSLVSHRYFIVYMHKHGWLKPKKNLPVQTCIINLVQSFVQKSLTSLTEENGCTDVNSFQCSSKRVTWTLNLQ